MRLLLAMISLSAGFTAWSAHAQCPREADGVVVEAERLRVRGPIRFDLYAGTLDPATMHTIDAVARRLRACPELIVEIQVHTDTRRATSFNARASGVIAQRIHERLIAQGVDPARVVACGYGESRPITSEGRAPWDPAQNRVEWIRIPSSRGHTCP